MYSVVHNAVIKLHQKVVLYLQRLSNLAIFLPVTTIVSISITSFLFFFLGFHSNFTFITDEIELWTPPQSKTFQHRKWMKENGFLVEKPIIQLLIHGNGQNILGRDSIDYAFDAVGTIRSIKGFNKSCSIRGVVNFFSDDYDIFLKSVQNNSDAARALSQMPFLPNGVIVNRDEFFGYPIADDNGILQSVSSYSVSFSCSLEFSSHLKVSHISFLQFRLE